MHTLYIHTTYLLHTISYFIILYYLIYFHTIYIIWGVLNIRRMGWSFLILPQTSDNRPRRVTVTCVARRRRGRRPSWITSIGAGHGGAECGDFMVERWWFHGKPTKKLEEHGGTCMKMLEKNVILVMNGGKLWFVRMKPYYKSNKHGD